MPTQLSFEDAWRLVEAPPTMWALLGVGGDEVEPVGFDLAGGQPTFLVAGPSRSGRSTALAVIAESLLRGGTEVVVGAPMDSPLRRFAGRHGVRAVITDEEPTESQFAELLDPGDGPVVLVVDDAEAWRDLTCRDWLRAFLRRASGTRRGVVIGGDIESVAMGFSGWQVDIKKNRRGALLSAPNLGDGDLVGARLSRSQARHPRRRGRGPGAPGRWQPGAGTDPVTDTHRAEGAVMADLVVTDLAALGTDLDVLISEFEGALDLEDDNDDIWGQLNANLSMGDFADNWTTHRNDMIEAMKKFREKVREVNDAWTEADRQLAESLVQQE